jgi:hypothetical protein
MDPAFKMTVSFSELPEINLVLEECKGNAIFAS